MDSNQPLGPERERRSEWLFVTLIIHSGPHRTARSSQNTHSSTEQRGARAMIKENAGVTRYVTYRAHSFIGVSAKAIALTVRRVKVKQTGVYTNN